MEFKSVIENHHSQIRFYRLSCLSLIAVVGLLAVVVPSSMKYGPYVVRETSDLSTIVRSEPWKLTVSRLEGFLKLYLSNRFEWSKDEVNQRKEALKNLTNPEVFQQMKESLTAMEAIAKNQNGKIYYLLEGFRFSNQKKLIEAQISRVIRIQNTGVVTPITIRLLFEEAPITTENPYGLKVKNIEEFETKPSLNGGSS